jgi:hypothetical protein
MIGRVANAAVPCERFGGAAMVASELIGVKYKFAAK